MNILELVEELQLESYSDKYFIYPTEFENILLSRHSPKNYTRTLGPILRFIRPSLLPEDQRIKGDLQLIRSHFLPSHKETELLSDMKNKDATELFQNYAPEYYKKEVSSWLGGPIINLDLSLSITKTYAEDKDQRSTSFFKVENTTKEDLTRVIKELKKEINSLKRHRVVLGHVTSDEFGVFEENMGPRTQDPVSIHCNFWKKSTGRCQDFEILGQFFKPIA